MLRADLSLQGCPHPTWEIFLRFLFGHAESWHIFAGVSAPYLRNILTLFVWLCWELTYLCRGVRILLEKYFYAFCLAMLRADISLQGCPHPTWETFLRFLFDYAESWHIFAGVSAPYLRNIFTLFVWLCWELTSLQGCPHPTSETFLRFLFDHAESWHIFAGVSAPYLRNIFTLFVWPCWELIYLCRGVRTLLE